MDGDYIKIFFGVMSSTTVLAVLGYIFRDVVGRMLFSRMEHKLEERIEIFKADIRSNEKELSEIRNFLHSASRESSSIVVAKRLEAAEVLLRLRHTLSKLNILVEYMKTLNIQAILDEGDDAKIAEMFESLSRPLKIDETIDQLGSIERTLPQLYISESSMKAFSAYESIVLHSVMLIKLFSIPVPEKSKVVKEGNLSKIVLELVPQAKDGFERWGDQYAFHWSTYFYDLILKSLREEISGDNEMSRNVESAERMEFLSREAQRNIQIAVARAGLSQDILRDSSKENG